MGKKKLLACIVAALLVPTSFAAFAASSASADCQWGGSDAVFTPSNPVPFNIVDLCTTSRTATPQNAASLVDGRQHQAQ